MKVYLLSLLLATYGLTYAQQLNISGKVVDQETKEPLPFASVYIAARGIGVVSNEQGEFDFHLSADLRNDILRVSMIGYRTYEVPVWDLLNNSATSTVTIELEAVSVLLKEVVVKDTLKPGDILKLALKKIDQNYPMQPFMLHGFYRDIKKLGNTYISLLEAAVKIYDEDYKEPRNKYKLHERVALQEVRRSIGYSSEFTTFYDKDNLLEDLLLNNSVRYRQFPDDENIFEYMKLEDETSFNNREVYLVSYQKDFQLKVYIDKETYGIIHFEYVNDHEEGIEKKNDLESKSGKIKRVVDFKFYEGKFYLNYINVDTKVNWYDVKTGKLKFEAELQRQLLINRIDNNPKDRIGFNRKMRKYGLQYQDEQYNEKFWDNYNIIKQTPLDKKIVEDLEREEPLDAQFKAE